MRLLFEKIQEDYWRVCELDHMSIRKFTCYILSPRQFNTDNARCNNELGMLYSGIKLIKSGKRDKSFYLHSKFED
jgi:hypothetical protein